MSGSFLAFNILQYQCRTVVVFIIKFISSSLLLFLCPCLSLFFFSDTQFSFMDKKGRARSANANLILPLLTSPAWPVSHLFLLLLVHHVSYIQYTEVTVCRFKCVCQLFQVGILIWRFQCQHGESQGQLLGWGGGGPIWIQMDVGATFVGHLFLWPRRPYVCLCVKSVLTAHTGACLPACGRTATNLAQRKINFSFNAEQ